ncbi:YALIA101S05e14664g1_1 [Yarrowia lipolytica]|nr:ER membrane protein complex subunit 1 [Yarrowia lipolytica]SEI34955.1 YALIA101S05e14664g1_1 [Yarrowia lipolytica]
MKLQLSVLACVASTVVAVFIDEVGVNDWVRLSAPESIKVLDNVAYLASADALSALDLSSDAPKGIKWSRRFSDNSSITLKNDHAIVQEQSVSYGFNLKDGGLSWESHEKDVLKEGVIVTTEDDTYVAQADNALGSIRLFKLNRGVPEEQWSATADPIRDLAVVDISTGEGEQQEINTSVVALEDGRSSTKVRIISKDSDKSITMGLCQRLIKFQPFASKFLVSCIISEKVHLTLIDLESKKTVTTSVIGQEGQVHVSGANIFVLGDDKLYKIDLSEFAPVLIGDIPHGKDAVISLQEQLVVQDSAAIETFDYSLNKKASVAQIPFSLTYTGSDNFLVASPTSLNVLTPEGKSLWSSPVLSSIITAAFIDKDEVKADDAFNINTDPVTAFINRIQSHVAQLPHLIKWFSSLTLDVLEVSTDNDHFFEKLLIVATPSGLTAIDTTTNTNAWEVDIPGVTKLTSVANGVVATTPNGDIAYDAHGVEFSAPESDSEYTVKTTGNIIQGYRSGQPTWTWSPAAGSIAKTVSKNLDDESVSIGTILGDRTVLYKYLYPNVIAAASVDETAGTLLITVLDSVTGNTLYQSIHNDVKSFSDIVFGEYWITYSYVSGGALPGAKLVTCDFYESTTPNERKSTDEMSAFDMFVPETICQAFGIESEVTALSVSKTTFGITSRDVIVALADGRVASIPRQAINPRRPVGRAATAAEMEEGLGTYDPFLAIFPQMLISHSYSLKGDIIVTSGATLESTSLVAVLSTNGDIFFTRIFPSTAFDLMKPNFSKKNLVYTVLALGIAVRYMGPVVAKRLNNQKWGVGLIEK